MKVLGIKDEKNKNRLNAVATLTDADLENMELLKKLKNLEAELKKLDVKVGKEGMFEIVEVGDLGLIEANRVLEGKEPLVKGLAEYVKQFELEIKKLKKGIEAKKAKEDAARKEAEEKERAEAEERDRKRYAGGFDYGFSDEFHRSGYYD